MKPTDFSMHLTAFLSDYLPVQKNVSRNTIKSYRDTFKLLLLFCEKEESLPVGKDHHEEAFFRPGRTVSELAGGRTEKFGFCEEPAPDSIHSLFRYA